MRAGQRPHGQDLVTVGSHRPVVMAVGADQVRQDLRIPGVRLRARHRVPVPVTRRGHRVHREYLVARRGQRVHKQAPVSLDPDHHLPRLTGMNGGQLVEPGDPLYPLGQPPAGQFPALLIGEIHVMMGLRPVHPGKDQPRHLRSPPVTVSTRTPAAR